MSFDRNMDAYKDFGSRNKSSLGELLFHFFRYYGHELDFEHNVVSVRLGRCLSKVEKAWHLQQDNRLCVEEPFNVSRNLANTADDTSMRGIHLELRRAFDLIGDGKLLKCCEQFVHPPDDIKPSEHFVPPLTRPVIAQLPTQASRGARGAARGGRNPSSVGRHPNGRRSSNPTGRNSNYLRNPPFQMTTHELQLQQQHQQHLLHDQLFQQYRYLQLQEQELRMQLYQQSLQQQRGLMAAYGQPNGYSQYSTQDDGLDVGANGQANGVGRGPLSAPLYQHGFPRSPYLSASQPTQGISTNPPSPRSNPGIPDTRRYSRRTSVTQSSLGGSLRAHSQPARVMPLTVLGHISRPDIANLQDHSLGRRSSASSTSHEAYANFVDNGYSIAGPQYEQVRRPAEYLGYYVGQSPSLSAYTHSTAISPIPSHVGLAIQNGGLSPRLVPMSTRPSGVTHTPPLQTVTPAIPAEGQSEPDSGSKKSEGTEAETDSRRSRSKPLIVDGSINSPRRNRVTHSLNETEDNTNFSASTSEDLAFDTPSSSDEHSQDAFEYIARSKSSPISVSEARKSTHRNGTREYVNGHLSQRAMGRSSQTQSLTEAVGSEKLVGMSGLTGTGTKKAGNLPRPLDRQLSAVEEVRTPSPRVETFTTKGISPIRTQEHVNQDDRKPPGVAGPVNGEGHDHGSPLGSRPNGMVGSPNQGGISAPNASGSTGWQTQKKKKTKRKTVKSENDAQTLNISGGEALPADEALRKGG